MFAYIHKRCGKPAWLLHYEPIPGRSFLSQKCYTLDNKPLSFATECRCQSCGEVMFEDAALPPSTGTVVKFKESAIKLLRRPLKTA